MYKLNKYPVISFDVQEARSRVKNGIDYVPMLQEKIGASLRCCVLPKMGRDCDESIGLGTAENVLEWLFGYIIYLHI